MLARLVLLAAVSLGLVLALNCGDEAGAPATGNGMTVEASEFAFGPDILRVKAGSTTDVVVVNRGTALHTFSIPDLRVDSGAIEAGRQARISLNAPATGGTYRFLCTFGGHEEAGMFGELVIE